MYSQTSLVSNSEIFRLLKEDFLILELTISMNTERKDTEKDIKMFKQLVELKKRFVRKFTLCHLILPLFFILVLSTTLPAIANTEPSVSLDAEMVLEKTVDSSSLKPGDKASFTITYSNDMSETAYNVTIFEWMPLDLTFISSVPFYDGASDPETGFYRWSRGNIPPDESGTVIVKAMVENVPLGTVITNTAHMAYEFENGTRVEVTANAEITVTQAAGVDVYPDQIHSVAPRTGAWTEYNVTVKNTGNAEDTFNVSFRSVAYHPSSSNHEWKIALYNSTGYPENPVANVYDDNVDNRTSWTDHGVLTNVTLASGESTWFIIKVTEAEGTSGSGDAYLDVQLIATSLFDPSVSDFVDKVTIVRSVAGITLAPDYSRYANPGDSVVYRHIVVNSAQTEVIDLNYTSPREWSYSFWFDNGTALTDTDGSGYVDVGEIPKNGHVYILVKVTVPYSTAAGINDTAVITATGVTSGNFDTANDTTTVKSAPVLGVVKELVSENPRYVGDVVTYRINITNLGNTRLRKITLDDAFETLSLNFSSADPTEDAYDETAGTVHWENLTALESGQSILVTVNFVATEADNIVRESANVIDAEDEFGNLISATDMNKELTIIGFYTLTVTASPTEAIGGSFNVIWTEHGVRKDGTFTTQKHIRCDQDTTAEVSYPESPINVGDVRYVFTHYLPSATVTLDSDKTVTLNYQTEYNLNFKQVGSYEPVYITIDGTQLLEALPQSFWVQKGSTITFIYPSPVADTAGTTRYVLTGVYGNTTHTSVTVNAPTNVTGSYKTEYYLSVTTDPVGLDTPQHSGWYDKGAYAKIEVGTPTGGDGVSTRYRFDHWTGTDIADTNSPSTEILMDTPETATANYVKQFKLIVISDHGSPDPQLGDHWYDEGVSITALVSSPADESDGTRYRCTGWSGSGSVPATGTDASIVFTITSPSSIEWNWKTQHYLTVNTDPVDLDDPAGEGWYDEGTYAAISVVTPTGGDGVSTRYRFREWIGMGIVDVTAASTTILMDAPKLAESVFIEQFYLTMSTNFGVVSPDSGWYDVGSIVSVEATAPAVAESNGYVWHGWTGTGVGSYSGVDNPATVTMNSAVSETAYWKIDPLLTIMISNETVASGDKIVVHGKVLPVQSSTMVSVIYKLPNGTQIEHNVCTDDEGNYEDTLLLDQDYPYSLFVDGGEWVITVHRPDDISHEEAQALTTLKIEASPVVRFHPALLAGLIIAVVLIAYVLIIKKVKSNNTWRRATAILCCTGLIFGIASLALNWMFVTGIATTDNATYQVDVFLYPFGNGLVSITEGIRYVGANMPSMVDLAWWNVLGSSGPVLTLYLVPLGCALALTGLYKPKNVRQRRLKVATLMISGILIVTAVVHALVFVQAQLGTVEGAGIGYDIGVYIAIISGTLTVLAGFFAIRETHIESSTKAKMS